MSVLFRLAAEGRITVLLVDTRAGHIILREIVYSMQYSILPWFLLKRLNISWWYFFQVFTSKLNWLKSEFCKKLKGTNTVLLMWVVSLYSSSVQSDVSFYLPQGTFLPCELDILLKAVLWEVVPKENLVGNCE